MQAPAHTTLLNQGIGADEPLGLGPIQCPKQQHASGPIAIETFAICPIATSGLVTGEFQGLQPSQVVWNHRIELGLGHDPHFQLHKPGHGASSTVNGRVPRGTTGLAVEHNYRIRSKAEACQANQKLKAS
jgi:hypothetical protein